MRLILFICTGNVCRSPMAEALLQARLPRKAAWRVASAGLSAAGGLPASREAIEVLRERGVSLAGHRSQLLTKELVDAASMLVVMTRAHDVQLRTHFPGVSDRLHLLREFEPDAVRLDLDDPIGLPVKIYRRTRDQIEAALPGLLEFIGQSSSQ